MKIKTGEFSDAIRHFWTAREEQSVSQAERGGYDQGNRSSVTGGKHMDRFVVHITDCLTSIGMPKEFIHYKANITALPGYFRPTKKWDMVIAANGQLIAALELKSQVGPSFGNNFNNRTEEAIGSAEDIWVAYREGAFGAKSQPWLGYFFVLEDCPRSRSPVKVDEPHFEVFPEFKKASYIERYVLLCRRLVLERKYSNACLLTTVRGNHNVSKNYEEPDEALSGSNFMRSLLAHASGAQANLR